MQLVICGTKSQNCSSQDSVPYLEVSDRHHKPEFNLGSLQGGEKPQSS